MTPHEGSVLGIDVGCSPSRRSSAVCRLDWTGSKVTWTIARFRAIEPERTTAIRRVAGSVRLTAAAFDGPLRRGFDVIGRYRIAERMLTRRIQPLIGKPGQASAPIGKLLNEHTNACASLVLEHCDIAESTHSVAIDMKAAVEAFPSSFLGVMIEDPAALGARRGDRSDTFFRHLEARGMFRDLIAHCLPGRTLTLDPSEITNHDDRAAFVCALTALCVASGDFVAVGDDDGWIILPPPAFVQGWAWELVHLNGAEVPGRALHVEKPQDE